MKCTPPDPVPVWRESPLKADCAVLEPNDVVPLVGGYSFDSHFAGT